MIKNRQHRVAAIHDLSGFGRCSLAVIMPVLSTMGIQCCPVPTAVLSTHTGGFEDIVIKDLTDYISPALAQYKKLGIDFDSVYSGFLASAEQIDHCLEFFSAYKDSLKVVDPVMGDHGKPYRTYTPELCKRMGELVHVACVRGEKLACKALQKGKGCGNHGSSLSRGGNRQRRLRQGNGRLLESRLRLCSRKLSGNRRYFCRRIDGRSSQRRQPAYCHGQGNHVYPNRNQKYLQLRVRAEERRNVRAVAELAYQRECGLQF